MNKKNKVIEELFKQCSKNNNYVFNNDCSIIHLGNGKPDNFNIYQLFYPYLYYSLSGLNYSKIKCIYLVRTMVLL